MRQRDKNELQDKLLSYRKKNVFTACALGVVWSRGGAFASERFFCGKTAAGREAKTVGENTFFDLASLTKPLLTVLCLLALKKEQKLFFHQRLPWLLPQTVPADKREVTVKQLIEHSSGLPAHKNYHDWIRQRPGSERLDEVVRLILAEALLSRPGERFLYSDLDYLLLAAIVEEKCGGSIAAFWKKAITDPLAISAHFYTAGSPESRRERVFAETGICPWSKRPLRGLVHDDNCRALGKVSGHAGLFATLDGVMSLCKVLLSSYANRVSHPSFANDDLILLARREGEKGRPAGFDTPAPEGSSAGEFFSSASIGHLGFTGTSFWLDLRREIAVVLLTNRVYYGWESEGIRTMRPDVHDGVMRALLGN